MTSLAQQANLGFRTGADFFAWYRSQEGRHEWVDGIAVAMAGPSPRHGGIEVNVIRALGPALRGHECLVLPANQMIAVQEGQAYRHADTTVVCGEPQFDPQGVLLNPSALIEILSESTEKVDRGDKWDEYRRIPSLRDYLLVSQRKIHVDHFQRRGDLWISLEAYKSADDVITLCDGVSLPVSLIYDGCWTLPGD